MTAAATHRALPLGLAAAVLALLVACDDNTDATLGACAESTPEWWPLRPGVWWSYQQLELSLDLVTDKDLWVQFDRSTIHGLLGDETAARTYRTDVERGRTTPIEAGWRWFLGDDRRFAFRRDLWVEPATSAVPCVTFGPDQDLADCPEFPLTIDRTFFPERTRLDLAPERLCERSEWTAEFVQRTIELAFGDLDDPTLENCALDAWREDPAGCPFRDKEVTDHWSVDFVDRTIDVPAGHFEGCLCVRRVSGSSDQTYCFAKGVGKVYEVDRPDHVECLSEYRIDADTFGPAPGWDHPCDELQLD